MVGLRSQLSRLGSRLSGLGAWIPLRPLGAALLAVALLALVYGFREADYLVTAGALTALGLVLLFAIATLAAALLQRQALARAQSDAPRELTTHRQETTEFRLPRLRALPFIDVSLGWQTPAGVAAELFVSGAAFGEVVTPERRGHFDGLLRALDVEDLFGLTRVTVKRYFPSTVRILPAAAPVAPSLRLAISGGDGLSDAHGLPEGDPMELRGYARGDPLKRIHWRSFARTRRLIVRSPERATTHRPLRTAFFVAGEDDEESASIARGFLETRGFGGGLLLYRRGREHPRDFTFASSGAAHHLCGPSRRGRLGAASLRHAHRRRHPRLRTGRRRSLARAARKLRAGDPRAAAHRHRCAAKGLARSAAQLARALDCRTAAGAGARLRAPLRSPSKRGLPTHHRGEAQHMTALVHEAPPRALPTWVLVVETFVRCLAALVFLTPLAPTVAIAAALAGLIAAPFLSRFCATMRLRTRALLALVLAIVVFGQILTGLLGLLGALPGMLLLGRRHELLHRRPCPRAPPLLEHRTLSGGGAPRSAARGGYCRPCTRRASAPELAPTARTCRLGPRPRHRAGSGARGARPCGDAAVGAPTFASAARCRHSGACPLGAPPLAGATSTAGLRPA